MSKLIALHERIDEASSTKLKRAYGKLQSEVFNLYSVGTFDRGKSQFLNALLGEAILPSRMTPTSAVVTEIRYGAKPVAEVFCKDKSKETIICTPGEARLLLAIPADVEDKASYESPYSKAIIHLPLEFLRGGIVLTDTPGISDVGGKREETTIASLPDADGLVFITGPESMGQEPEIRFLQKTKDNGYRDIFIVVNKFDTVDDDADATAVMANTRVFRDFLRNPEAPEDSIFFISARNALSKTGPTFQWEQFQKRLQDFLRRDRSRVKLSSPIWESRESIRNLRAMILERQPRLKTELTELETSRQSLKSRMSDLQKQRAHVCRLITLKVEETRAVVRDQVEYQLHSIISRMETGRAGFSLGKLSSYWRFWLSAKELERTAKGIADEIEEFVLSEYGNWVNSVMYPALEAGLSEIRETGEVVRTFGFQFFTDMRALHSENNIILNGSPELTPHTPELDWQSFIINVTGNPTFDAQAAKSELKKLLIPVQEIIYTSAVAWREAIGTGIVGQIVGSAFCFFFCFPFILVYCAAMRDKSRAAVLELQKFVIHRFCQAWRSRVNRDSEVLACALTSQTGQYQVFEDLPVLIGGALDRLIQSTESRIYSLLEERIAFVDNKLRVLDNTLCDLALEEERVNAVLKEFMTY